MTEKQQNILKAALKLFASEGYNATSTSKVAREACVSEGLIFRHFVNKEGLLKAIIEDGEARARYLFTDIVMEADPKEVIRKTIELPFSVPSDDYEFWRLQFKLKWEMDYYNENTTKPLLMALTNAFSQLEYESPELEAELLVYITESVAGAILKGTLSDPEEMKRLLESKYLT